MYADGGCKRGVANVVLIVWTKGAWLVGSDHAGLVTRAMFFKNSRRDHESARRCTVVMEAGGLSPAAS